MDGKQIGKQSRTDRDPVALPALHNAGCRRGLKPPASKKASGDVVGEVAEPEGGAAEVFKSAVDRLRRAVAGAGPVEVGEHIAGALAAASGRG